MRKKSEEEALIFVSYFSEKKVRKVERKKFKKRSEERRDATFSRERTVPYSSAG